nr:2-dehydropantoate 2-reductase [Mycobacterium lepraemurium]
MKITVIGCGAMGSIYAAKLTGAGEQVLAVDRHRPSVERINRDGLRVTGPGCDQVVPLRASTGAVDETMDLVVLAVKAANVEAAARQALPMLGPDTAVLTIQNGLGAAETSPASSVRSGWRSGSPAGSARPGWRRAMSTTTPCGRCASAATRRCRTRRWNRSRGPGHTAGFDAAAVTDIAAMQWEKLICNVAYSAPCALTGMTVGQVMDDAEMGPVSRAAATEAWSVARASGVAIAVADAVEHVRAFGAQMPDAKPSALLDHEARRVSEIDVINGAVPRQGGRVGVDAPVNATLTAVVKSIGRRWR